MPFLGLAGCHQRDIAKLRLKWQVRWVDQTQYPMIVVASLSAAPQSCSTLKWILKLKTALTKHHEEKNENQTNSKNRHHQVDVLHLFRCSTHTHTCPCLILRSLSLEWRTGLHHRLCRLLLLSLVTKAEPKSKLVLIQSWHPMYSSRMHQAFNNPCLRPKLCHSRGNATNAS